MPPGVNFASFELTVGLFFFLFFTEVVHLDHISGEFFFVLPIVDMYTKL